jgi:transcriptional regulator with XRE-family HTH domain
MDKPSERFRFLLGDAMEAKRWTQSEMSRASGVPTSMISLYLQGKRAPSIDVLVLLAAALEVSTDSLLGHSSPTSEGPRRPTKQEMALFIMEELKITEERRGVIRSVLVAEESEISRIQACIQRAKLKEA